MSGHSICSQRPSIQHHRRYSWPPTLHLIDISEIHIPLPDIDEDPFAHFISSPPVEDDFDQFSDALACRAGLFTPHPTDSAAKEKAHKFATSIARKWKSIMGWHHTSPREWAQNTQFGVNSTKPLGVTETAKRHHVQVSGMGTIPKKTMRIPSQCRGNQRRGKWARHSWHAGAPSKDLPTIEEEMDETDYECDIMIEKE